MAKIFNIAFPWPRTDTSKPQLSPKEIRKRDRRRQRHDEKRRLRDEERR